MENKKKSARELLKENRELNTPIYEASENTKEQFVSKVYFNVEEKNELINKSLDINERVSLAYRVIYDVLSRSDLLPKTHVGTAAKTEKAEQEESKALTTTDPKVAEVSIEERQVDNYYEVLGVERDADPEEIKKARKKLAKKINMDQGRADMTEEQKKLLDDQIVQINLAYEVLSDENLRIDYDKVLDEHLSEDGSSTEMQRSEPKKIQAGPDAPPGPNKDTADTNRYAVRFKPTEDLPDDKRARRLNKYNKEFQQLHSAGPLSNSFTEEEIALGKSEGTFARDFQPVHYDLYMLMAQRGAPVEEGVDYLNDNPDVPEPVRVSMFNATDLAESYRRASSRASSQWASQRELKGFPDIEIVPVSDDYTPPSQSNEIVLQISNNIASPIADHFKGKATDKVKSKAKNKILKRVGKGAAGKVAKKAAKRVGKKLAKKVAEKGLKQTIQHGTAALLSEIPVVGTLAGEVLGKIIAELTVLTAKLIKKYSKYITTIGIGIAAYGVITQSAILMGGGTLVTGVGVGAGGTSLGSAISSSAALFLNLVGQIFVVAVLPTLLVTIIVLPVIIAFITYIITTGAYVVPQSTVTFGSPQGDGELAPLSTCPIAGDVNIVHGSYDPETETGHGSNTYWDPVTGVGGEPCRYDLPVGIGCRGPLYGSPNNVCNDVTPLCAEYGYAIDILPTSDINVYLPDLGEDTWDYVYSFQSGGNAATGYGHVYQSGIYTAIFLHLNQDALEEDNIPSGTVIGQLFDQGNNTHLHFELLVNGTYVKPEEYVCGSTGVQPSQGRSWLLTAPISTTNIVASTPDEYGQLPCDWSGSQNLDYATNANFYHTIQQPILLAGYGDDFTNYPSNSESLFKTFLIDDNGVGEIVETDTITDTSNIHLAVTGVSYSSQGPDIRPRTMLGINGQTLYLLVLESASPMEARIAIESLGVTDGFALDGGTSTALCQGGFTMFGNQREVANSIGVVSGTVTEQ